MLWAQSILALFSLFVLWESITTGEYRDVIYWFLTMALFYFAGTFDTLTPLVVELLKGAN